MPQIGPHACKTLFGQQSTAYHEAAHAVIGRVLGLDCGEVTVVPNEEEGEAGHSLLLDDAYEVFGRWQESPATWHRELRLVHRAYIIMVMAGAEAEDVLLGHCSGDDGTDRRHIAHTVYSREPDISAEAWRRYEPRIRRQTRRLVREHRDKIERVAAALLKHGTLTGSLVDELIED